LRNTGHASVSFAALTTAAPAGAAPAHGGPGAAGDIGTMAACRTDNWRLIHGQTGLNAVVEPGAPLHVRLRSGGGGYEKFLYRDTGPADDGAHGIAFFMDRWFACALDSTWVEIRSTASAGTCAATPQVV
jgi:hypothetical protein